jgi:hypothetical protein
VKRLLLLASLFLGFTAHAGVMLEPYVGYAISDIKYKSLGATREYADTANNAAFGARLGYKFMIPWVAVDYMTGSGTTVADKSLVGNTNKDYTLTSIGGVVGADVPMGLRVWGGYGFSNTLTVKGANGAASTKYTGSYTKGGIGFKFIPKVSVNAEYIINKYTKYDVGGVKGDVSSLYSTFDQNTIFISVSAPFSF